jgi:hypothetical protein
MITLDAIYTVITTPGPDGPIEWRVRRVDPQFAAKSAMLLSSLGVIVGQAETEAERLQREHKASLQFTAALSAELDARNQVDAHRQLGLEGEALAALEVVYSRAKVVSERARRALKPRVELTEKAMAEVVQRQQQLVIATVRAARYPDQEWEAVTFVADEALEIVSSNQLWIGRLDDETFGMLIKAAWQPAQEAAERLATFRRAQKRAGAPAAVPDGQAAGEGAQ